MEQNQSTLAPCGNQSEVTINKWRIHRYVNALYIYDLTNAGRRGKKVQLIVLAPWPVQDLQEAMEAMTTLAIGAARRGAPFNEMKDLLEEAAKKYRQESSATTRYQRLSVDTREERGIDVKP